MAKSEIANVIEKKPARQQQAIQLLLDLEAAGAADEVSLRLTDPDMPYQTWEDLGRFLGHIDRRAKWYIGDWLNFGEAVYGEQASQAIESTMAERYSEVERVTGLDEGTIRNIRTVCARVPRRHRRKNLGFWIHQEVTKLEGDDQKAWLIEAEHQKLRKSDLRRAINIWNDGNITINDAIDKALAEDDVTDSSSSAGEGGGSGSSVAERIEAAARLVYQQGSFTSEGDVAVPKPAWVQLAAALGEE